MKIYILVPLLGLITPLFGQDTPARTYEARVYGSAYVLNSRWHTYRPLSVKGFDVGPLSLALSTAKGAIVQELELGYYGGENDLPEYKQQLQQVHLRYEYGVYIQRKILKEVRLRVGGAWQVFYQQREEIPRAMVIGNFRRDRNRVGLGMDFVSHFEVPLRPRLFLDVSLGFLNFTYALNRSYSHNPGLPEQQRKLTNFDMDWLALRQLRLGLGYRL